MKPIPVVSHTLLFATLLGALAGSAASNTSPTPATTNALTSVTAAATSNATAQATSNATTQAAVLKEENTDVIDLEEIDDSAEAAKLPRVETATDEGQSEYVDISCDNATLADILRQFRKTTKSNLIYNDSTNLQRRISTELRHVPWQDALQSILNARGFRLEQRGEILFVNEDKVVDPILTRTFTLNHASAEDMAKLFNQNYAPKSADGKIAHPIANAFSSANVVVVSAPEKVLTDCEMIVKAVDKAVAQIYIEARFLELSSGALRKLGIDWSSLESWRVTASSMKGGWQSTRGTPANYGTGLSQRSLTGTSNSSTSLEKDGDGKVTSESLSTSQNDNSTDTFTGLFPSSIGAAGKAGFDAADMAWESARGFSGQLSAQDFSLALSAFESLGEGKIFSNPKVIVSNGKEANVDMTTKFPNVDVTSQRNTSTQTPYTDISTKIQVIPGDKDKGIFAGDIFYSWGITLSVKPRISPDGLISVVITPTISQLDTTVSSTGFYEVGEKDVNTSSYSKFPIIEMKRITTEFTMNDGATAVIGGLSKTEEKDIDTGIPYLRKIPWIGPHLFGWKSRQKVQSEIIVCVTIGIANPANLPKDIGLPKNAILGREYVAGRRLEPGDREGVADTMLTIDMDTLDEQHEKRKKEIQKKEALEKEKPNGTAAPETGTVTIVPSASGNAR